MRISPEVKRIKKEVALADLLILCPPVPPPPAPPILFHSGSTATHMYALRGPRQVWPGKSSLACGSMVGEVGKPGGHTSTWGLGGAISCFQKGCPARVPAPHFSFHPAFLHRHVLLPPTFLGTSRALQWAQHGHCRH